MHEAVAMRAAASPTENYFDIHHHLRLPYPDNSETSMANFAMQSRSSQFRLQQIRYSATYNLCLGPTLH